MPKFFSQHGKAIVFTLVAIVGAVWLARKFPNLPGASTVAKL